MGYIEANMSSTNDTARVDYEPTTCVKATAVVHLCRRQYNCYYVLIFLIHTIHCTPPPNLYYCSFKLTGLITLPATKRPTGN